MTPISRLLTTAAILPLALPAAAVTPEEVWTMLSDVGSAAGATVEATPTRDGDTLTVPEIAMTWTFPLEAGELSVRYGPVVLVDNGDDTVSMIPPDEQSMAMFARISAGGEEGTMTAEVSMSQPGAEIMVTGTADDMTLTSTTGDVAYALTGFDIDFPDPDGELEAMNFDEIVFTGTATGGSGTTRYVREADVIRMTMDSTVESSAYEMRLPVDGGGLSTGTGGSGRSSFASTFVLPRGEMSVMNLADAIRAGLSAEGSSTIENQTSRSVTSLNGQVLSDQLTTTESQEATFSFGEAGLDFGGTARTLGVVFELPDMLPFPVEATIAAAEAHFALPVLASPDAAQPVEYDISLEGLTLSEQIWSLFDPAQMIPREPVDLTIDLGAEVRPLVDLLNIPALIEAVETGETPIELDSVRIDALELRGAGVEVTGDGAFDLDFTDMMTFPGMPRPEGSAKVQIFGAQALIDTLIEMGLMTPEDAMGARMGLAMFTRQVTEDVVESEVVIDETGGVFVNGQQMR